MWNEAEEHELYPNKVKWSFITHANLISQSSSCGKLNFAFKFFILWVGEELKSWCNYSGCESRAQEGEKNGEDV